MAYTSRLLAAVPGVRHAFLNAAETARFDRASLVDIKQVHGCDVLTYRTPPAERPSADGVFADLAGQKLGIYTADCLPLLMASRDGRFISSVHAGWRGAAEGIIQRAVAQFVASGIPEAEIVVAIGPHIGACCYEVSDEFYARLLQTPAAGLVRARRESLLFNQPRQPTALSPAAREAGSQWFALADFCVMQLAHAGVAPDNIEVLDICTYCTPGEVLGSYRRRTHAPAEKTQQISWIAKMK